MVRFRTVTTVLAVLVLLAGCSRVDLVFSVLQSIAKNRVTDHLLLDAKDKAFVEDIVDQGFADIRRRVLPVLADRMRSWADTVEAGNLSEAFDARFVTDSRAIVETTTAIAAPYAAKVLIHHRSPEKLSHLKARLEDSLAERVEDSDQPRSELIENWMDRTVSNFERFTGDLTQDQVAIAHGFSAPSVDDQAAWLKNRAERQAVFVKFLATQPSEAEISAFVSTLILRPHELVDPDYKKVSERRWTRLGRLVGSIMRSLDKDQRAALAKNLRAYARDFDAASKG